MPRTGVHPVLLPVREREGERESLPFGRPPNGTPVRPPVLDAVFVTLGRPPAGGGGPRVRRPRASAHWRAATRRGRPVRRRRHRRPHRPGWGASGPAPPVVRAGGYRDWREGEETGGCPTLAGGGNRWDHGLWPARAAATRGRGPPPLVNEAVPQTAKPNGLFANS